MAQRSENWKLNSTKADSKKDQAKSADRVTFLRLCLIFHLSRVSAGTRICIQLSASNRLTRRGFFAQKLKVLGFVLGKPLLCPKQSFSQNYKKRSGISVSRRNMMTIFYSIFIRFFF